MPYISFTRAKGRKWHMPTQDLVSVIVGDSVKMKIVGGSNGEQASEVARAIRGLGRLPDRQEAYWLAVAAGFGDKESLIVIDETGARHYDADRYEVTDIGDRQLYSRYRGGFGDPYLIPCVPGDVAGQVVLAQL